MNLVIIIPAFNEEKILGTVISSLKKLKIDGFKTEIVVINDGSTDRTLKIAKTFNVTVLDHMLNRGLGGALGTGLQYAKLVNDSQVSYSPDVKSSDEYLPDQKKQWNDSN